jgi:hypothetical protein
MYIMEKVRNGISKLKRVRPVDASPRNGNEKKQEKMIEECNGAKRRNHDLRRQRKFHIRSESAKALLA